jgi:hypothetical protein
LPAGRKREWWEACVVAVRIGTWNVENLARPGVLDGGPSTDAAYNAKLASLAEAITALNPDVLAVQGR